MKSTSKSTVLHVGMDVHKESIAVSVLEGTRSEARPTVTIPNDPSHLRRLFGRLKKEGDVRACYEAGSCGYEVQRLLAAMRIACDVVAPSLIPVRVGDRVKTDRRDAEKLARLFRAGELASIRVPTEAEEALRDLVRCREDAREDVLRERHRDLQRAMGGSRARQEPSPRVADGDGLARDGEQRHDAHRPDPARPAHPPRECARAPGGPHRLAPPPARGVGRR